MKKCLLAIVLMAFVFSCTSCGTMTDVVDNQVQAVEDVANGNASLDTALTLGGDVLIIGGGIAAALLGPIGWIGAIIAGIGTLATAGPVIRDALKK